MSRLTNQTIVALKGEAKRYDVSDDGGVPGLAIRVAPTGRKSWNFRYRTQLGKQRRVTLGQFGSKTGLGLKDARDMARGILADVARGDDPALAKQEARRAEKTRDLKTLADLWGNYRSSKGEVKRSAEFERDLWERKIRPAFGHKDINEITKGQIARFLQSIGGGTSGTPTTANRVHALMRQLFNHGIAFDALTVSPMTGVSQPYANNPRDRFLNNEELELFWNGLDETSNISPPIRLALKLLMVTGQRRVEVAHMSRGELNLSEKLWSLPKTRRKNGRAHDVPLSDLAVSLIEEALAHAGSSDYIFPSPRDKSKPVNEKALTRAWSRVREQLGIEDTRLHDFRRTLATGLQRLGVRLEVTEAILNHKSGSVSGIVAIYQRHDWKVEKREALEAWAKVLLGITHHH
jgi:integrase